MRLIAALKSDLRFQYKHGFYAVYTAITVLYIIIMQKIPSGLMKDYAAALIVFSDPAMLGFFFIGGIIMLEKQQGIIDYLAVTPLTPQEYIQAKVATLGLLSIAASILITLTTHFQGVNWLILMVGIAAVSVFFTLYGFLVAAGCRTINQYFLRMIPYLLLTILPCFAVIEFPYSWVFNILPNVAGLKLTMGAFLGISWREILFYITVICVWNWAIYKVALRVHVGK